MPCRKSLLLLQQLETLLGALSSTLFQQAVYITDYLIRLCVVCVQAMCMEWCLSLLPGMCPSS